MEPMETVAKRGNSLELRVPNIACKLSEMLSKINEQNIHEEIETSGPIGKEIW